MGLQGGQGWPGSQFGCISLRLYLKGSGTWGRFENVQTGWTAESVNRAGFLIRVSS